MTYQEEQKIREEIKYLRQRISLVERSWQQQRLKSEKLEGIVQKLEKENKDINEENIILLEKIEKLQQNNKTLQGMIFKPNKESKEEKSVNKFQRLRGGQIGHIGHGRKNPHKIHEEKEAYLTHCPNCGGKVEQSNTFYERIVEDIILPLQSVARRYSIQRQWCGKCQKEVHAIPQGTIEGSRLGINATIWMLFQKYRLRIPLEKIREGFKEQYDITITAGGIQNILHKLKKRFGEEYQKILDNIRGAPIKHADETGWRIEGMNSWCWLFATEQAALYTIEETRGKGVPKKILGEKPQGVLVRDDYGAYENISMEQQSCWAHLLRKSREAKEQEGASKEVKDLHEELGKMFSELKEITEESPFNKQERMEAYMTYAQQIKKIQTRSYKSEDTRKIQTRICNQGERLITALKYENAPLTNNHAEKQIRPMVVTRKISGGSQSNEGAATHAVNMSIVQTISLKGKNFFSEMKKLLKSHHNVSENSE